MVRTVFIDTDVITNQLDALPKNRFAFGFLCGQTTRAERDFIHLIVDGVSNEPKDLESFFDASSTNKELCAKIIEITSSLCAGVSIVGFYCRTKSETLKSTNFTLKIRRLFEILQKALQTYSPWSLKQSEHRILLQSEMTGGANKWLVKTMDLSATNVAFRPVEMKTFDSRTQTNWCFTTTIPVQFPLFFSNVDLKRDENVKLVEKQFEEQLKNYVEQLKESLLLMDDRLLPDGNLQLTSRSAEKNSFDIQWLAPIDGPVMNEFVGENRRWHQIDGSVSLRLFTTFGETSGADLREYFLEDLFRSMLIRMNLALVNNETSANSDELFTKFILPRRVFPTRPLFISAYQLPSETFPMVIESFQENFKINSILEDDLEVAEQFPPSKTEENNKEIPPTTKIDTPSNFVQENKVLLVALSAIFVLLVAVLLKLFS